MTRRLCAVVIACWLATAAFGAAAKDPALGTVYLSPFTIKAGNTTLNAEEGLVFVPENRAVPNSRTITVHFIRLRGTRAGAAPIFFLPGGPGSYNTRANIETPRFLREIDFLRSSGRDVLFVNQRGNPFPPLAANMFWPTEPEPLDQPGTMESEAAALRRDVTRGQSEWKARGVDLRGYDIINIADDVEDLRLALGYGRIILRGGSFGSQWSFAFLKRHPESVDRALLRGIEPLDYGYDSPKFLWNAVQRVAAAAEADPALASAIPPGGLIAAIKTIEQRLEQQPQTVTITNPKDKKQVSVTVGKYDLLQVLKYPTQGSYRDNLTRWPRFIIELYRGDYRYLAALALQSRTRTMDGPMIGLLIDNSLGISRAREAKLKAEPEQQWIGPLQPEYFATRDITATAHVPESFLVEDIARPVVLFQGDMDFSTPMENAQHQAGVLRRGHLTIVHYGTHSVDDEVEQLLPEFRDALERYLAADSDADINAAMQALPAETALPKVPFETVDGPSLYERWLKP